MHFTGNAVSFAKAFLSIEGQGCSLEISEMKPTLEKAGIINYRRVYNKIIEMVMKGFFGIPEA